jgi:hypothetical protein
MRLYRDSLQFLLLANPRKSASNSRVLNPNFHYREYDRNCASLTKENIDVNHKLPSKNTKRIKKKIYKSNT